MDNQQVVKIIQTYRDTIGKIKEALKEAQVPDALIEIHTINLPQFDKMFPNDVVAFFNEIKVIVVLYLDYQGFSLREISRRTGVSHVYVSDILKKYKAEMVAVNNLDKKDESAKTSSGESQ